MVRTPPSFLTLNLTVSSQPFLSPSFPDVCTHFFKIQFRHSFVLLMYAMMTIFLGLFFSGILVLDVVKNRKSLKSYRNNETFTNKYLCLKSTARKQFSRWYLNIWHCSNTRQTNKNLFHGDKHVHFGGNDVEINFRQIWGAIGCQRQVKSGAWHVSNVCMY